MSTLDNPASTASTAATAATAATESNRITLKKLIVIVAVMFTFGYALVPFYKTNGESKLGRRPSPVARQRCQLACPMSPRRHPPTRRCRVGRRIGGLP